MNAVELAHAFRDRVANNRATLLEQLATGYADVDRYRFRCGEIHGLDLALDIFGEVIKAMNNGEYS